MKLFTSFAAFAHPRLIGRASIIFLVIVGVVQTGCSQWQYLSNDLPVLLLLPDRTAQARYYLGADLYDMLAVTNAILPPRAAVLLVTPGDDPRHAEYFAFHRALYHLAPRPVWWVNPATPDGTWESRWWIQSPITTNALEMIARQKNISFILFDHVVVPSGLDSSDITANARLVSLRGEALARNEAPANLNILGLTVGLLVMYALGHALVVAATSLGYKARRMEHMALAWLLGAGATSILMLWLNALGLSLDEQIKAITTIALVAVLALERSAIASALCEATSVPRIWELLWRHPSTCFARSGSHPRNDGRSEHLNEITSNRLNIVRSVLVVLIALETAYVALLAVGRPLITWDAWVNWAMKARIIFLDNSIPQFAFVDASRTVTHLDYPLLLPLVEAWTFSWAGTSDDWLAGIPSVFFFASLLILFHAVLRRLAVGETLALVAATGLATIANVNGQAVAVFADLPLAAYAAIASIYFILWLRFNSAGTLAIAALAAGMMPWTKREGIVLLLVLCLAIFILTRDARRARLSILALIGSALFLAGPWWAFVMWQGIHNATFIPMTPSNFVMNLSRLPHIVRWELPALLSANWSFIWPLSVLNILVAVRARRQAIDLLPLVTLAYLIVLSMGFIFSDFVPYQQHVVSSIDRILMHVFPLALFWLASRAGEPLPEPAAS